VTCAGMDNDPYDGSSRPTRSEINLAAVLPPLFRLSWHQTWATRGWIVRETIHVRRIVMADDPATVFTARTSTVLALILTDRGYFRNNAGGLGEKLCKHSVKFRLIRSIAGLGGRNKCIFLSLRVYSVSTTSAANSGPQSQPIARHERNPVSGYR
jgi:hypothetical protein